MDEIDLPADQSVVDLGYGISLHPRGLFGRVRIEPAPVPGSRDLSANGLLPTLAAEGLRPGPVLSLPSSAAAVARGLAEVPASRPPAPTLEVEVKPDESCVLLAEDANGGLTWLLPDDPPRAVEAGSRGLSTSLRFTLPRAVSQPAPADARGLLGDVGSRVQAFFFDATDALLGPIIHGFAKKWEAKHRPSFVRRLGPIDYRIDDPAFERLSAGDWTALSQGRALLFVHGTFSTSAAFRALTPEVMGELANRYCGRTFAFNHPTLTADPRENALAFLGAVPQRVKLEIDIVCHSRGGLVARQIEALGRTADNVSVRSIVFVGATNAGTVLADDDHMVEMVSRFTTLAKVLPEGTAKTVVDALVLAVKVLGHGLLHDLEGLAAMNPSGTFMKAMNVSGEETADFFAIASDFEPVTGTPLFSLKRVEDAAADRIFGSDANDLVVPRDGVFSKNGARGFPIGAARCLQFGAGDGVVHTEYFAEPRTSAQLLEWLAPTSGSQGRDLPLVPSGGASAAELARVLDTMRDWILLQLAARGGRDLSDAPDLTPEELDKLRPHVVNLSGGAFKASGIFSSTKEDVDTIVHEQIPKWAGTLPAGEKLRIVVWAHGGLIGEKAGLRIAQKHVDWWKKNGVYPIYFVWETGLFDALRAILEQVRSKIPGLGGRDLFDFTSDPLIELGARALGGVHIWGAMKRNAELSSAAAGGARYVAQQLGRLANTPDLRQGHELELHAAGHSAGSIFHSWFLPAARAEHAPAFKTLQLLAPAITVEEFTARLAPEIGGAGSVEKAIVFTMKRAYEEADNCADVYRKSLLYLIHHALEPEKRTPVLGLEISLRADPAAARLFGLQGTAGAPGRAVWSVTDGTTGRSASASVHHGDFDDDIATMSSVAANVLDEADARVRYPGSPRNLSRGSAGAWPVSDDWLRGVDMSPAFGVAPLPSLPAAGLAKSGIASANGPVQTAAPSGLGQAKAKGTRRALCVGIDEYKPPNTLLGCVNDTKTWGDALEALGFQVSPLLNEQATRQAIINVLTELVRSSKTGDVLVFQYSGHGTRVTDLDGDEADGQDEALVPYDFESGAFLIDDDLRGIFGHLRQGVNLTCFIDCCHSGTITRMLGRNADESTNDGQTRSRYLKQAPQWNEWMRAHERFRQRERAVRDVGTGGSRTFDANMMRWVNFSACDSTEVAYETQGSGDFTKLAAAILNTAALQRSNRDFQDAVIKQFGERRRQTPQLDCADQTMAAGLLQPLG